MLRLAYVTALLLVFGGVSQLVPGTVDISTCGAEVYGDGDCGASLLMTKQNLSRQVEMSADKGCDGIKLVPLAEMSRSVYGLHDSDKIDTLPSTKAEGFKLEETHQEPDYKVGDVFRPAYAVWTRESPCKQAVLAIKGTSVEALTDLRVDIKSIVMGVDPEWATTALGKVVDKYKNLGYLVFVTGHSLGGYMGEIISTHNDIPGAVFCAPGPDGPKSFHNGKFENKNFHNVNAFHDPFGNLAPGLFQHKQWSIYVKGDNTHSLKHMIDMLKAKPSDMTNANVLDYCTSTPFYWELK